jgi:hypothetical protein
MPMIGKSNSARKMSIATALNVLHATMNDTRGGAARAAG